MALQTIDLILNRCAARAKETDLDIDQLYVVTSRDSAPLASAQPVTAPVDPSALSGASSAFLGLSIPAIRKEFLRLFGAGVAPSGTRFTHNTFIVLDARSLKDETCLLVSCSVDKGEARSDFSIPVEVLTATEMGSSELNEGIVEDKWADLEGEGLIFYDVERWKKYVKD